MGEIMEKLSEKEIAKKLANLSSWELKRGALERIYQFSDFKTAFAAMTLGALVSEELNHHPEWTNLYKTLTIRLSTHEVDGISERDFKWIEKFDRLVNGLPRD